jgi:peptidoglycan/LPS O-acetylase OafA/YrhL
MGRNLYILAATLGVLAAISFALSYTNIAQVPGSPGDVRLWRTTSTFLVFIALVVALAGILSQLFEQAERRASRNRQNRLDARRRRRHP